MRHSDTRKARSIMESLVSAGWVEQALLIDAVAVALGGDEAAKLSAQRAYDEHMNESENDMATD